MRTIRIFCGKTPVEKMHLLDEVYFTFTGEVLIVMNSSQFLKINTKGNEWFTVSICKNSMNFERIVDVICTRNIFYNMFDFDLYFGLSNEEFLNELITLHLNPWNRYRINYENEDLEVTLMYSYDKRIKMNIKIANVSRLFSVPELIDVLKFISSKNGKYKIIYDYKYVCYMFEEYFNVALDELNIKGLFASKINSSKSNV